MSSHRPTWSWNVWSGRRMDSDQSEQLLLEDIVIHSPLFTHRAKGPAYMMAFAHRISFSAATGYTASHGPVAECTLFLRRWLNYMFTDHM